MTTTKKKSLPLVTKTMLPEVLPDPRRPSFKDGGISAPRHRTMAHMQRLLATAAAVGVATAGAGTIAALGATTAGCGKSTKVPDGNDAKPDNNGNTSGYAVVDPMPPPAHCPGIAQLVAASAKFVVADGGEPLLVVRFPNPKGRSDYKFLEGAPSVAYGGIIAKTDVKPDAVTVTIKPEAAAANVTVTVKGHCDAGPSNVMARITWTGPIKATTSASISLDDMYDY
jgi:hypothetical protein